MFEGVPVKSIDFHHSKRSQVRYGLAESYKVTFNSTGPFTDDILSKAWQTLNKSRAIGRRYISNLISSFGVLGFTPASECLEDQVYQLWSNLHQSIYLGSLFTLYMYS